MCLCRCSCARQGGKGQPAHLEGAVWEGTGAGDKAVSQEGVGCLGEELLRGLLLQPALLAQLLEDCLHPSPRSESRLEHLRAAVILDLTAGKELVLALLLQPASRSFENLACVLSKSGPAAWLLRSCFQDAAVQPHQPLLKTVYLHCLPHSKGRTQSRRSRAAGKGSAIQREQRISSTCLGYLGLLPGGRAPKVVEADLEPLVDGPVLRVVLVADLLARQPLLQRLHIHSCGKTAVFREPNAACTASPAARWLGLQGKARQAASMASGAVGACTGIRWHSQGRSDSSAPLTLVSVAVPYSSVPHT